MNQDIEKTNNSESGFYKGLKAGIPIALGVGVYGVVFGILTRGVCTTAETMMLSTVLFAGLSQLLALELWAHPLPVFQLVITTFIVNLRHILMGASIYPYIKNEPAKKVYPALFFLVDENWAITMKELIRGRANLAYLLGSGLVLYIAWAVTTFLGRTAGAVLPPPEKIGIDFAMTAVFLVILTGMYRGKKDIPAWVAALIAAIITEHFLPGKWYILAGGFAGAFTGWLKNDI